MNHGVQSNALATVDMSGTCACPQVPLFSFTQGFILGQVTVGIFVGVVAHYLFFSKSSRSGAYTAYATKYSTWQILRERFSQVIFNRRANGQLSGKKMTWAILNALNYSKDHPPESLDWANVVLAQVIAIYRSIMLHDVLTKYVPDEILDGESQDTSRARLVIENMLNPGTTMKMKRRQSQGKKSSKGISSKTDQISSGNNSKDNVLSMEESIADSVLADQDPDAPDSISSMINNEDNDDDSENEDNQDIPETFDLKPIPVKKRPLIELDYIEVINVSLGDKYPTFKQAYLGQNNLDVHLDFTYEDKVMLEISTAVIINVPQIRFGVLPVTVKVIIERISGTVILRVTNRQGPEIEKKKMIESFDSQALKKRRLRKLARRVTWPARLPIRIVHIMIGFIRSILFRIVSFFYFILRVLGKLVGYIIPGKRTKEHPLSSLSTQNEPTEAPGTTSTQQGRSSDTNTNMKNSAPGVGNDSLPMPGNMNVNINNEKRNKRSSVKTSETTNRSQTHADAIVMEDEVSQTRQPVLQVSLDKAFQMDIVVTSLLGSRTKLQNERKLQELITSQIRSSIEKSLVAKSIDVPLPALGSPAVP